MIYEFGEFRLDAEGKRLLKNEVPVEKTEPSPLEILTFLVTNQGREFSEDSLLEIFWDKQNVSAGLVSNRISTIRSYLGEDAKNQRYIKTRAKNGYKFFAEDLKRYDDEGGELSTLASPITEKKQKSQSTKLPNTSANTPNKFNKWLFNHKNLYSWLALVFLIFTFVVSFELYSNQSLNSMSGISSLQLVILLSSLLIPARFLKDIVEKKKSAFWEGLTEYEKISTDCTDPDEWKELCGVSENFLSDYIVWWKMLIFMWVGLYVCFICIGYYDAKIEYLLTKGPTLQDSFITKITSLSIINTALNNLSTGAIYICFFLLYSPTKLSVINKPQLEKPLVWGFSFIFVFTMFEFAIIAYWDQKPLNFEKTAYTLQLFSGASGVIAATVMAMWFARLQSKYLNPPQWFTVMLFGYTAIQPFFIIIDMETWGLLIINAALIFKVLLILYMTYLFESERLFFYFLRIRKTYLYIENEFDNFDKIMKKTISKTGS